MNDLVVQQSSECRSTSESPVPEERPPSNSSQSTNEINNTIGSITNEVNTRESNHIENDSSIALQQDTTTENSVKNDSEDDVIPIEGDEVVILPLPESRIPVIDLDHVGSADVFSKKNPNADSISANCHKIRDLVAHNAVINSIQIFGDYLYTCSNDKTAKRFSLKVNNLTMLELKINGALSGSKKKDQNEVSFSEWCKKINEVGHCFCFVCPKKVNYRNNGKKALKKYADDKVHKKNFRGLQCASLFPGSKQVSENATLSLNDRRANQKAVLACFVAENSLPFSLMPKLVELCQTLAKDRPALSKLKMERTAATYITGHGVAKTMREELVAKLNKNYFPMNVDEAINNNGYKIINVLDRVYDDEKEKIITAHLGSRKENISTANNIFLHLKEFLDSNEISFSKVISCLLDNSNTMRGCKKGVEKLLRDANKNLLHIDGNLAHKFRNTAKLFFSYFDRFIEDFANNVFNDINESPKATELFVGLPQNMNLKYNLKLIRPIDNRFLQMLTIRNRLFSLKDALMLYYASFLSNEETEKYHDLLIAIFHCCKISEDQKRSIHTIQSRIKKQKRSDGSISRKDAVISALFFHYEKFHCLLVFYREFLPYFNEKVKRLHTETSILHQVHSELFDFLMTFYSFFLKPKFIPKSVAELKDFQVLPEKTLNDKYLNVGNTTYGLIKKAKKSKSKWVDQFFISLREAYLQTSTYILKNCPLNNKCLLYFSALNPKFRKESSCLSTLISLGEMLPNVVPENDMGSLIQEVKMYIIDERVDLIDMDGWEKEGGRIDVDWWSQIFKMEENGCQKYKILSLFIKAVMSVFSGPLVEGTFNIMDDIITDDRTSLTIQNYEACSLIKYYLRSQGKKSTTLIPGHKMRQNIFSARRIYHENLKKKKK
ncbi:hypothetical protein AVEN_73790-1 [Araneus ventricosus]|uniref:DUF4371 domain-containing protein n=1 Tax=Araneus ventricosus TaxID=182803 RepID=A0A4Y2HDZ0_ARAVE|nr:hypothetical protein AVEN_73790-1 [Araneus ventricosus]